MKHTIIGAGAIGGTIGAYMARAGEQVELVDIAAEHVEAMKADGLTIRGYGETFTTPVRALHPAELAASVAAGETHLDVVLLAVKAQHTAAAVRFLLPLLGPSTAIVSLQNGLCERIIADLAGPERTVGCFVNFSADYIQPGLIHYGGPGAFYLGELDGSLTSRLERIACGIRRWGQVRLTRNIWGYLWGKLGYANMLFATAVVDADMADVIERHSGLMVELATEVYEVAAHERVRPEPFDAVEPALYYPRETRDTSAISRAMAELVRLRRLDQKTRSGIWRDLAVRRRPTEVDQQIGMVAQIGASHGLRLPLTNRLVTMIHELERGERERCWANVVELESLRAKG
jgi:2-dehydropantoate 2-reductase